MYALNQNCSVIYAAKNISIVFSLMCQNMENIHASTQSANVFPCCLKRILISSMPLSRMQSGSRRE